ncbi:MAG TPA: MBL fold metallo-hydrolase [Vicinamibacterales bacterium]|nr:MBL fold metallo-hydrolase [Vicinamibacterales bacterium]
MKQVLVAVAAVAALVAGTTGQPGATFPKWTPGTLDIHQINTGRGNAAFLMLPDGTTMLIDAGNGGNLPPRGTPPKPDASRTPAEWIVRYVRAMGAERIDYGLVTHFHDDHMGAMAAVMRSIPVLTSFDRAWPTYAYPSADHAEFTRADFLEYRALLAKGVNKGERLIPGGDQQLILKHDRARYPEFHVRNIAANGEVWTGVGTATRHLFPDLATVPQDDLPTENMSSLGIRMSYGRFDYYTGGDIPGRPRPGYPAWHDVETAVAKAVGAVEAAVVNHHGNRDSTNEYFVSTLHPRLWIIPVWSSDHPGHDVLDRIYSTRLYAGPRDVFATNMIDANKLVIGPLLDRLANSQGHIVIRVAPGGATYQVFTLDDASESYQVRSVFGPYASE